MSAKAAHNDWLAIAELGTAWGIRVVVAIYRLLGRAVTRAFLRLVAAYYLLVHGTGRRASFDFWRRVAGAASWKQTYRHFVTFAVVAFDRLVFVTGKGRAFEIHRQGREHLEALTAQRRGALLLGAHLGSFDLMRAGPRSESLPLTVVANFANAERLNGVLDRINPKLNTRVIAIDERSLDSVLRIRECVERGELVAILADRARPGTRSVTVDFLGGRARMPAGPFILAAALGCPVLLTFGLYRGGRRYDLYCEPFADRLDLPRAGRGEALQREVQRFADRLAHHVMLEPDNWFNFYQYWE